MSEEKFYKIEMALAHQEQQIQDLNDMMNRQWSEIDRLKALLAKAQDKINAMEAGGDTGQQGEGLSISEQAALEKPPHY